MQYIKIHFSEMNIKEKVIRVKLAGDGTKVGPLTMLNFSFTLPDLGAVAKTANGNFQLGCFEIKSENYETLKVCLAEIAKNVSNMAKINNTITIDNEVYKIKFLLGGDMKFLHTVMGLNSCNSNNPCLWCKLNKDLFSKSSTVALHEIQGLKRNSEEQKNHLKHVFIGETQSMLGYSKERIFDFIDFEDCVFDTLHLLLRIVEKMMKLFVTELENLDHNNSTDINDSRYQCRFYQALKDIGILNPTYLENGLNKLKSFTGDDCLKILENLKFDVFFPQDEFPNFDRKTIFNSLLRDFNDMFLKIKSNFYSQNSNLFQTQADAWLSSYTDTFQLKHVTGYMHLFCHHLNGFVEEHEDVDVFNCQGLEKRNHQLTREYFVCSNRRSNSKTYQYQMMAQRNRMESYKKTIVKPSKKRNCKLKLIRNSIYKEESSKFWMENIFKGLKINSSDTYQNSMKTFSKKVRKFILLTDTLSGVI
jgi:hypothetical protein